MHPEVLELPLHASVITLDWKEESRKKAPGGDLIAFPMQSRSEAGLAPYGDHMVLVPRYKLLGPYHNRVPFKEEIVEVVL